MADTAKGVDMKDELLPSDKWRFDEEVTKCFDDMLSRSIPQYDVMRKLIFSIGIYVLDNCKDRIVLDLGCSNGLNIDPFVKRYGPSIQITGIDVSEPMLAEAAARFDEYVKSKVVKIINMDLRKDFPPGMYNLITSVLTIQFIPMEYRQDLLQKVYDHLVPGGCFILVEKVLGNFSQLNNLMVEEYTKFKMENGYSIEQIDRKKLSLEGVLVPVTSDWNQDLLRQAGFTKLDVFWRWMNFEAYVCFK
jgi:tRNA (cmo5U34)-methyltransferase